MYVTATDVDYSATVPDRAFAFILTKLWIDSGDHWEEGRAASVRLPYPDAPQFAQFVTIEP